MMVAGVSPAHETGGGIGEAAHVTDLGNEHLDDTVRLWDAATSQPLGHTNPVTSVALAPTAICGRRNS
jgi:hypothetical protein